jgi:hypothetical protein
MRSCFGRILGTILLAAALPAAAQQTYDGPPSAMARYWEVPAFKEFPHVGPSKALGMIFWSHSLAGNFPVYHHVPPPIIFEFAGRGWDVTKVQRNPNFETGWTNGIESHVADLAERVAKARAAGYKSVILAGQYYGATLSLEAASRIVQIFGVLAFAPGQTTETCGLPSTVRVGDMVGTLTSAIEKTKSSRVVLSLAAGDPCHRTGHPGAQIERALQGGKAKYVHFDQATPIRGRGAAETTQFDAWYRDCLIAFMAPDKEPAGRKTVCPAPANARFLVPAGVKLDATSGKGSAAADMTGPWSGTTGIPQAPLPADREICVIVDKVTADGAIGTAYFGAGPEASASMTATPFQARKAGQGYTHQGAEFYALTLMPRDTALEMTIVSRNGRNQFTAQMKRGCSS